ncbi:S8 family serine peptidase [Dyadobacter sp. CY345]|uniref:S8 family serine peptidase n=1 Tax=Dyadobacter sp. CY345 TaxID=2909335 RepID=UPI001F40ECD5|nr:S8 family serine peptidase [Dyadobacter sp. CY345]MCF2444117.1 S8 family serine peptidase [Dyadobacter sp. CY345]
MRSGPLLKLLLFCLTISFSARAQKPEPQELILKNGSFAPSNNIDPASLRALTRKLVPFKKKVFVIIQFDQIPSASQREQLQKDGIELLDYVPNNAYTATVAGSLDDKVLRKSGARSVISPTPKQKLQVSLANGTVPEHAKSIDGFIDVWVSFLKSFTADEIIGALKEGGYQITSDVYKSYQVLEIRLTEKRLMELAALPYIQYIQAKPKEDKPVNNHSIVNGRANVLGSSIGESRNLHGEGVVVGVGDNADPMQHIDLTNRIINRMALDSGAHGVHVMGTLGGAGIVTEKYAGYAPKVKMIAQLYSNILAYAPTYVQDFGMVITNNSYGNDVSNCSTFGDYDLTSNILDQQAFQMPYLQHVFAAGNSGATNCAPFTNGFGNVVGGYQAAKNVITVGNTTAEAIVNFNSSKGPVSDGRTKPEISAQGTQVVSSYAVNNGYINSTGTSMAAPAVSGGLALLYQQYRKLHNQENPKNGLMKALICNGSIDKGNAGPDYQFGFGWMNLLRSVKMLESNSYRNATVANSAVNSFDIVIPANTAQVKVMLYWNDPAASILAAKTLVNDLDLTVENSSVVTLPKLLDPNPANVNVPATTGADHINNMEQVIINNPGAGTYKINVNGTAITQGANQEYFVVYDIVPASTTLTYPIGKERLAPGDVVYISWDAFGNTSNEFRVQYSKDDGVTWNNIAGNSLSTNSLIAWSVPDDVTDKARIKIMNTATGAETISEAFTIVRPPSIRLSNVQCEGYIALEWDAVPAATDYEVMILQGDEMVSAGVTSNLNYTFNGLSKDDTYWFSVRARVNGNPGPRANALSRKPDAGTCAGAISDNDLIIESIVSPASSGRQFTPTMFSPNTPITIRIKNLDDQVSSGNVALSYAVNNGVVNSFTVPLSINGGATLDYTFPVQENFSALGIYSVSAAVSKAGDPVTSNNSVTKIFKQLPNAALALPFIDNVESVPIQTQIVDVTGLEGADRYDLTNTTTAGRLRTFVNSGMAFSGNKVYNLDVDRYFPAGNSNFLDGTFNLSNYNLTNDVRLYFRYKNHGQTAHPDNSVWARGSYNDPWIPIYDLDAEQNPADRPYKLSKSIELRNFLLENNQNFSTSTQIRWGQHGTRITADPTSGAGYSFDDITLKVETDDVQLLSLNSITENSCGLGAQHPVTVTIRNSADNAVNNVSVSYKLGNGQEVVETIPTIGGKQTIQYTFTTKLNLSAQGRYAVKVAVSLPTDTYLENNVLNLSFYNNALISAFPYLENFETNNGNWHSSGTNNSWAYGTPASTKINRAASGSKAWKTNLTGNYNNQETSYLYSPCFDITGMANPTLSLSLALDIEFCGQEDCDLAFLEYSIDGNTWIRLGAKGQGTNWYNKVATDQEAWSIENYTRWHVGTITLPVTNGNIRLRVVMKADPGTTREGIAIDDVHIYDSNAGIYDEGTTLSAVSQQPANASGWIDFKQNGKLVASINPNGQQIGNTGVQAFINPGAVRNNGSQYYLDRNVTIKPANNSLSADATVRIYFLDSEIEKLINAGGCTNCTKISTAYEAGISKYTDADKSKEDGDISNNSSGIWSFIAPASTVKVPYDNGYYAEIKVRNFSEFWINNGGNDDNNPLPVELISFNVSKDPALENPDKVLVHWETSSEMNSDHFEIQRADGDDAFKIGRFKKIGEVRAFGNSISTKVYSYVDNQADKSGNYYYRLKMIDADESFEYSAVKSISFDAIADWRAYPNPTRGNFDIQFQASAGSTVYFKVLDLKGNRIYQKTLIGNGTRQILSVDLTDSKYASGLYVVEVTSQEQKKVFRVIKL